MYAVNTRLKLQGVKFGNTTEKDASKTTNRKQQYTGILHCLYKITTEEGLLTLWNGTLTSIILCCNPAINLGIYHFIQKLPPLPNGKVYSGYIGMLAVEKKHRRSGIVQELLELQLKYAN